ncbi:MAG: TetR family transcriptional regulator [Acidimicrobiia bacterium]|nr:TetR family transcriptional regulator [Acidimicrobiia bacterium]
MLWHDPRRCLRSAFFAAAAHEFASRGYAGARVDRIAQRARVNKAMLYYHFGSKRQLYRALLRTTSLHVAARLREVGESSDRPEQMMDRVIATFAEIARERAFFPAVMLREIAEGGAHLDRETLAALGAVPMAFSAIVARGVAAGAFRPVPPIVAYFITMAPLMVYMAAAPIRRELAKSRLLPVVPPDLDAFIGHLQQTMRRALENEPSLGITT